MVLFSRKDLTRLIVPLIVEQLFAVTIGMADSLMVSTTGEAAISGVSLVDTINLLLVYLFSALSAGGAVVISQLIGKGDMQASNKAAKQLVWVVLIMSTFLGLAAAIFRAPILKLIFSSVEADVMANAKIYFLFTALSYPFLGLYNACAAIYRSMGNSKMSMKVSLIMNVINVAGNAVLIFGFKMGAAGAAIATLVSRVIGSIMIFVLLHKKDNLVFVENFMDYKPDFPVIKRICAIGIPTGLENGMFQLGKVLTISIVAEFSTAQIAANAVGNSLAAFHYTPGIAVGFAMVTVVGRCMGAGKFDEAKKYGKKLLGITYIYLISVAVILVAFLNPILKLYSLGQEATVIAKQLIIMHTIVVCLIHPCSFAIANIFRAANDVKFPLIISMLSMWIFRVGLSYVFGLYFQMGVIGVWCAMFCDWVFRTIVYLPRFISGKWRKKYKPI